MKYQVLFSLKNNEEVFKNVVCCSCDRRLRVKTFAITFQRNCITERAFKLKTEQILVPRLLIFFMLKLS